jgi:CBS domain-containing protein
MQDDVPQPSTSVERTIMVDPLTTLQSPTPERVSPDASLADVIQHMRKTNIGYVLITDGDGRLMGIFTERDLLCKVAGQITDLSSIPISDLMTPNPTVLKPEEPIKHALFLMAHNGFRHIPLVDEEGRPHAITTVRHVVECIEKLDGEV